MLAGVPGDHRAVFDHVVQRDHVAICVRRERAGREQIVGKRRGRAEFEARDGRGGVGHLNLGSHGCALHQAVVGRHRDVNLVYLVAVAGLAEIERAACLPHDDHAVVGPHIVQLDDVAVGVGRCRRSREQVVGLRPSRTERQAGDHRGAVANHDRRGDGGTCDGASSGVTVTPIESPRSPLPA